MASCCEYGTEPQVRKVWGISGVGEQLLASQEGLCFLELMELKSCIVLSVFISGN
jgi:hypothetical protein